MTRPRAGTWALAAGNATLEITEAPLRLRCLHNDRLVLESCTDLCADGTPRLPTISRLRRGDQWTAAFALASGEPVYGLGEQFGPLNKRGQLVHSWVDDAQGVNTGRVYKSAPFAWSPGVRPRREGRRLGTVRAHAGPGHARRRLSRLVASLLRAGGRR